MDRIWIASHILAWPLLLAQLLTLFGLLFLIGKVHITRSPRFHVLILDEGPDIHSPLPELQFPNSENGGFFSREMLGREWLLVLASADCSACNELLRACEVVRRRLARPPDFVFVLEGNERQTEEMRRRFSLPGDVFADEQHEIGRQLGVERSPYCFLMDSEGVIRMKGVANNREQLEGLISRRGRYAGGMQWQSVEQPASLT